jgi:hypothetical protein
MAAFMTAISLMKPLGGSGLASEIEKVSFTKSGVSRAILILITSPVTPDSKNASLSVIDLDLGPVPSRINATVELPMRDVPNDRFHRIVSGGGSIEGWETGEAETVTADAVL